MRQWRTEPERYHGLSLEEILNQLQKEGWTYHSYFIRGDYESKLLVFYKD